MENVFSVRKQNVAKFKYIMSINYLHENVFIDYHKDE